MGKALKLKGMPGFGEQGRGAQEASQDEYRVMEQRQGWVVNKAGEELEESQCHQHRERCIFLES